MHNLMQDYFGFGLDEHALMEADWRIHVKVFDETNQTGKRTASRGTPARRRRLSEGPSVALLLQRWAVFVRSATQARI